MLHAMRIASACFLATVISVPSRGEPAEKSGSADTLCFVQFHHPGDEHVPDTPTQRTWNREMHRRKFMEKRATYVSSIDGKPAEGDVVFWGEWEPPSMVVRKFEKPGPDEPCWLFRPVLGKFEKAVPPLQNTDPFVYGGSFLYGNCKQNTKKGLPTELQSMKRGSVILFGSNRRGSQFVLDTVFVVADWTDYTTDNYAEALKGKVPPEYFDITLNSIAHDLRVSKMPGCTYRLYSGATHAQPYQGMFSYFPCKPWKKEDVRGFARPVITLPGVIDNGLKGWQRMNPQESTGAVVELWKEVTRQVLARGLALGVRTDIPGDGNLMHAKGGAQ